MPIGSLNLAEPDDWFLSKTGLLIGLLKVTKAADWLTKACGAW
jgi:hypothetical protein